MSSVLVRSAFVGRLVEHIEKQEAHQLVGQAKRRATEIRPNAVGGGISAVFRTSMNGDRK